LGKLALAVEHTPLVVWWIFGISWNVCPFVHSLGVHFVYHGKENMLRSGKREEVVGYISVFCLGKEEGEV